MSELNARGARTAAGDIILAACRDRIHLRHEEVIAPKRGGGKPKDLTKKAIMLSGPPGIGKTSSALIIARWDEHLTAEHKSCLLMFGTL